MSSAPATDVTEGFDRPGDARFLVQRGVFLGPSPRVNGELYVRIERGHGHRTREFLELDRHSHAHGNTYFGRFAASYWQRWTSVKRLQVRIRVQTSGRVRIRLMASDIAGHRRIVDGLEPESDCTVVFDTPLDRFIDGGALWLEFETFGNGAIFDGLEWTVEAPERVRPLSVAICTFNRAIDCSHTVAALASDPLVRSLLTSVYVVDQGTDHVDQQPDFQTAKAAFGDALTYIRQPNLGGAGGFTRGLYEITATPGASDIILMDDDILCEPETVLRMRAFANMTTTPTLVGAQMLFLLNPDFLNVGAEQTDLRALLHGRIVPKSLVNKSMLKRNQERRVDAEYNAWWTCLIPSEVIDKVGLPLPMFFQWDDVEIGLRAREAGHVTVTLPNAGVWHADFYWKDYDDWARYFSTRNSLIVASLHGGLHPKDQAKMFARQILELLTGMQYGLVATMLRAIEDFLSGPSILDDGGMAAMKAIREERRAYGETTMHQAADAPVAAASMTTERAGGEPSLMRAILVKRFIGQWTGKLWSQPVAVTREDAHWWHISKFSDVMVTDASQGGVRVRRRDPAVLRDLLKRSFRVLRRYRTDADAVAQQYRDAYPRLISRENWARLYDQ